LTPKCEPDRLDLLSIEAMDASAVDLGGQLASAFEIPNPAH
jgi:hypothetical protein